MKIWREIWDYARMIILVVIVVTLINNIVLINAKIPSESMENTIMTGDRIFGYRLAYGLNIDLFGHEINKSSKILRDLISLSLSIRMMKASCLSNVSSGFPGKKFRS